MKRSPLCPNTHDDARRSLFQARNTPNGKAANAPIKPAARYHSAFGGAHAQKVDTIAKAIPLIRGRLSKFTPKVLRLANIRRQGCPRMANAWDRYVRSVGRRKSACQAHNYGQAQAWPQYTHAALPPGTFRVENRIFSPPSCPALATEPTAHCLACPYDSIRAERG